ncbi:MAG: FtsW/RodA/SpoVE family cell cycle protein [Oscillospiraceae bacterium]
MNKVFASIKEFLRSLDKTLLLICLTCSSISLICLYSFYATGQKTFRVLIVQGVAIILGIVLAMIISIIDYHTMAKLWKIHAPIAIGLVVLTYIIGTGGAGASAAADDKAWLNLGFTTIQPAELLKLSFIFTFALHLSKVKEQINQQKPFLLLCLHGAVPTVLVMLQGDFGTALVFFIIFAFMMFVAGLSLRFIAVGLVASIGVAPLIWNYVLPSHLQKRFLVAWHPESDPLGAGMQQFKGRIAVGSGGLFGRGIASDNLFYVSESHNDFIFSYIGQTLGFVGTITTLLLIIFLCVKILMNSKMSKDNLGTFICIGVFSMFLFQAIINIGMVLCIIPVIGITLPFFSAGGTSVTISYMAIGMVLSVYRHNKKDMMFD